MKKWIIAALAVLILGYGDMLPFENMDAGELCIVQTLFVEQKSNTVLLYAENIQGRGENFASAAKNMEENAPGRLFLRQVKRIVFCRGAEKQIHAMEIPEEIPLGVAVYVSGESAQGLMENLEDLEKRLEVKEQTEKQVPTLAQVQNAALKEGDREDQ